MCECWKGLTQHDFIQHQEVNEVNGVQIPSTLNIQTQSKCQSMLSCGHNGVILMDATFALAI